MNISNKFTGLKGKLRGIRGNKSDNKSSRYINKKKKFLITTAVAGFIIVSSTFGGLLYYKANAVTLYHVYVDGEEIGIVNDQSLVNTWEKQEVESAQSKYDSNNITVKNEITFKKEVKFKGEFDNFHALSSFKNKINIEAAGAEVVVNGKLVGYVKDKPTADRIIDQIKQAYTPKNEKSKITAFAVSESEDKDIKVDSIDIKEKIDVKESSIRPDKIVDENTMRNLLQKGTLEEKTYTVQEGDTISEIAAMFNLTTAQVYQLNPNLSGELIHIGDKLNVTAMTPLVTVEVRETVKNKENIPYKVVYKKDSSMYVNESKRITQGRKGSKEVEYSILKQNGVVVEKNIVDENVLQDSIDEVIVKGTKPVPVRGSGELEWPTMGGVITSYFGPRWGKFHEGLDISGVRDRTIKAADNGKVIYAGWRGTYGNAVMIDHGNGIVTLYGHMSSIKVNVGDRVAKGQRIGIMGTTGNSTGVHLHFEVRVNGIQKNPLNYVGI